MYSVNNIHVLIISFIFVQTVIVRKIFAVFKKFSGLPWWLSGPGAQGLSVLVCANELSPQRCTELCLGRKVPPPRLVASKTEKPQVPDKGHGLYQL